MIALDKVLRKGHNCCRRNDAMQCCTAAFLKSCQHSHISRLRAFDRELLARRLSPSFPVTILTHFPNTVTRILCSPSLTVLMISIRHWRMQYTFREFKTPETAKPMLKTCKFKAMSLCQVLPALRMRHPTTILSTHTKVGLHLTIIGHHFEEVAEAS
ncbi:hypothetical protein OBBRIDRAFT_177429 [Obba rivulosa]|uniref:Uncharacterized protein n=1 Tax=Obba rivulosa TaxID=1052685 RepID=A0A8E2DGH2_9APHY|nr:hypothetical protein OBBRIDRAFT_177429 [Obba rivulosa]